MTERRQNKTGRSISKLARTRDQKLKGPPRGEPFVCLPLSLLESDAFRSMNNAEVKVLSRLMIEHMHHGGNDNGFLPCRYDDFSSFGVRRCSIRRALQGLEERGFIRRVRKGHLVPGRDKGAPSLYRITFFASRKGSGWEGASNEWRYYRISKL